MRPISRACSPTDGSSRTYTPSVRGLPSAFAIPMRCASPPESDRVRRSSVRYSSPTSSRSPTRRDSSRRIGARISTGAATGPSPSSQRARSGSGQRTTSVIGCPPTRSTRPRSQPRPAAVRTFAVRLVLAQEEADVGLVLLARQLFQVRDRAFEPLAPERAPVEERPPRFFRELAPRRGPRDSSRARALAQPLPPARVARLGPRIERAFLERARDVGHDQRGVELEQIAEAAARGARAVRAVEREQGGARPREGRTAPIAAEVSAEAKRVLGRIRPRSKTAASPSPSA